MIEMKNYKKLLILSLFLLAIIGMISAANAANTEQIEKTNTDNPIIEFKKKVVKYNVTFNANGGKIENKKTTTVTVKKGAKIGTLPKTPKFTGHIFNGWYTKKSGGTKISVNTKISKNTVLYAQWKCNH